MTALRAAIERVLADPPEASTPELEELFASLRGALNSGEVRAAVPDPTSTIGWRVEAWVKQGILLGFRLGTLVDWSIDPERQPWLDRSVLPPRKVGPADGIRIVPGGTSLRDGAFLARGVVCMPPSFVNIGAWIGEGTLVDSHVLVGSCAQIGARCHLSAGVQIGGVLEPINALPVIVEDEVFVGALCGIFEGTIVGARAVIGAGVILTRSTPVFDLVRERVYQGTVEEPLVIPAGAVVVAGSRPIRGGFGESLGLQVSTPLVVKYRDEKTDARVALEASLRGHLANRAAERSGTAEEP